MAIDSGARRVNRAIMKQNDGHPPGTLGAILAQRDDWETPADLFATYNAQYKFSLDPCANARNAVCETYFDREQDGLTRSWGSGVAELPSRVWLHPPHSEPWMWVRKAVIETQRRTTTCRAIVALLPARTGDGWWHDFVIAYAESIRFLRGTPRFRLNRLPMDTLLNVERGRPLPGGGFAVVVFQARGFRPL